MDIVRDGLVLFSVANTSTHKTDAANDFFYLTYYKFALVVFLKGNYRGILISLINRLTFGKIDGIKETFYTCMRVFKEEKYITNKPLQGACG